MKIPLSLNWTSLASDSVIHTADIVLIDDEPACLDLVSYHLRDAGYENLKTFDNSVRGRDYILEVRPDIVLLDHLMPSLSGLDILREIRGNPPTAHTPIIMLTASTDSETKATALKRGATDFITKPIVAIELILRVRNALVTKAYQDQLKLDAEVMDAYAEQVLEQQGPGCQSSAHD